MTDEQFGALMAAVSQNEAAAKANTAELQRVRGELIKVNGALTGIRGELVIMQADQKETSAAVENVGAKVDAVIQTVGGIKELSKSAFDMGVSATTSIRQVKKHVGIRDDDEPAADSVAAIGARV